MFREPPLSPQSRWPPRRLPRRSEEHTSELQSHSDLVCRLLLEKKKQLAGESHAVAIYKIVQHDHIHLLIVQAFARHARRIQRTVGSRTTLQRVDKTVCGSVSVL